MTENILVLPDTHYPDHDVRLWKAILRIVKEMQPDEIIHIGDLMDYPQPSRWTKGTRAEFEGNVYEDSEKAVRDILEPLRDVYDGTIRVIEGNHDCLDTETRAVTDQGLKSLDELTGDERVMSVDDDGDTIWEPINKIVRYPHTGKMYRLNEQSLSGLVTGNHRLVGLDRLQRKWQETTPTGMSSDRIYAFAAGRGNERDFPLSDETIRLAAWCITDSFYSEEHSKWTLYQSGEASAVPRELLESLGIPFREVARDRGTQEIAGVKLKQAPKVSYEFHFKDEAVTELVPDKNELPEWVWSLSERQFRLFLDEMIFCDGTDYGRGTAKVLYVCRESLREDLMILCAANGVRANAHEYRPGHWRLNLSDLRLTGIYRDKITEEDYDGEVWCLQVPNGRFFVEREGKIHLTGNCRPRVYMEKYAPALSKTELFNFDKLLKFDDLGIETAPNFYEFAPGWIAAHGHLGGIRLNQNAGMTALNAAKKIGKSLVMGHTHRAGICSYTVGIEGKTSTITGVEVGHVMDTKKVTYLKGATGNWQQGIALLKVDGKHVTPQLVPVSAGKLTIDERTFKI